MLKILLKFFLGSIFSWPVDPPSFVKGPESFIQKISLTGGPDCRHSVKSS